jgi:hypothetical protein
MAIITIQIVFCHFEINHIRFSRDDVLVLILALQL